MSETDDRLQTNFYPQNGGVDDRLLWYGTSSQLLDVRFWWEPDSNDKGKIMVHSDSQMGDLLMGACDHASRVVSYVVVMGQGL